MSVKAMRLAKQWSQHELARQSKVKQGIISDIESGKTNAPRIDTLLKLSRALGCTIDDLVGKEADPQ